MYKVKLFVCLSVGMSVGMCPEDVRGPFVISFTDSTSQDMVNAKSTTLSVQPGIIPFSTLCQFVAKFLVLNLILTIL